MVNESSNQGNFNDPNHVRLGAEFRQDTWTSSEDFRINDLFEDPALQTLAIRIDEILGNLDPCLSSKCCIYKVPQKLRKLNEEAYTPRAISIGPFHHHVVDERLRSMDALKNRYFKILIERSNVRLRKYVEFVKGFEGRVRECYAKTIKMSSDDFVIMILIDACFIIELLLRSNYPVLNKEDGHALSSPWLRSDIRLDLILLENQIPFFVLEKIFDYATSPVRVVLSLKSLTLHFFKKYNRNNMTETDFTSVNHFADLILIMSRPLPSQMLQRGHQKFQSVYSATELHEAGVKFQVSSSKCLLDIKFSKNVLTIPSFKLNDHTETFMRNLMALELCHYPTDSYIIDYILFIDHLINTSRDIDLLARSGVIVNYLGESSVAADLINSLCVNITVDHHNFYFSSVCEDLNAYYKVPVHKWKATFRHDYFSTPWKSASTIAAFTFLVLTFIQAICSILSLVD